MEACLYSVSFIRCVQSLAAAYTRIIAGLHASFLTGVAVDSPQGSLLSSEGARPAPMLPLEKLVERYRALAARHGKPVALAAFDFTRDETERIFSSYDEDYHISRFFHFTEADGMTFAINGERVSHVAIDPEIDSIL